MRALRFVIELIFFFVAGFLVVLGLTSQKALGAGLMIGSVSVAVFIGELFFSQRAKTMRARRMSDLNSFLWQRLGFDWRNEKLLDANNMTQDDIAVLTEWFQNHRREEEILTKFWRKESMDRVIPIGMNWASGYTPNLDKFGKEWKDYPLRLDEHFFFSVYKRHIEIAERILAQSGRNNVLLVGEEGVGKHFVLMGLERLIETGRALPELAFKRFVWLNIDALLAGVENTGVLRERLGAIFSEALYAGIIVLGIERIHSLLDPAFPEISDVLVPFLQSDRSQVVATTTPQFYSSRITPRSDMVSEFVNVTVEGLSLKDTLIAMQEVVHLVEKRERVFIPYLSLKKLIDLADRFSLEVSRPQRDINLLEEAISFIKGKQKSVLEPPDILELLSERTGIPMGAFSEEEKGKLLRLEEVMHERLVDQEEAVSAIAKALKRGRAGVRAPDRPIGTFLFLGPTGVGKTTAAKALASLYFGREDAMIRFDMSEYQNLEDVNRLIDGLAQQVRKRPYTVLLLDEIEKSHLNILNLFLQVLDEGVLTDTTGLKVDFRHLIIIGTSNAGSEFIRAHINEAGSEVFDRELLDYLQKRALFRPEFLNRFDAIVTFKPLGTKELKAIAHLLLQDFALRMKKDHAITFVVSDDISDYLAQKGFDPAYGARPMRRLMQDTIETLIAERLIKGEIKKGDRVQLGLSDLPLA